MRTIVPIQLSPEQTRDVRQRIIERTARSSDEVDACWSYTGRANDGKGYYKMRAAGELRYVHRLAWLAFKGPIPDGLVIDHRCRNSSCCNPSHLVPVTVAVNTARGNGAWVYSQKKQASNAAKHAQRGQTSSCRKGFTP